MLRFIRTGGLLALIIIIADVAFGAMTTGGVNWLDRLGYTKPQFIALSVPDESTATKYYLDLSSGSDSSSCGTGTTNPCKTLQYLADRGYAPLRGGPAFVYIKGNGYLAVGDYHYPTAQIYGSSGNEIVIKPWPGVTAVSTFTAASESFPNTIGPPDGGTSTIHHIIMDGGPNLQFEFLGNGDDPGNSQALTLNANDLPCQVKIQVPDSCRARHRPR